MKRIMNSPKSGIDEYISDFPREIQNKLNQIRRTVKAAAPDATETIKYSIPTFVLNGNLVHFAAFKNHISFYPGSGAMKRLIKELKDYEGGKGTIYFSFDEPIPLGLITRIVRLRVKQNLDKAKEKSMKTCRNGHKFNKSSNCPVCPVCEKKKKPKAEFMSVLGAPARRALENYGISSLKKLSSCTESELLALHGIGPGSIPKLRDELKKVGRAFRKNLG